MNVFKTKAPKMILTAQNRGFIFYETTKNLEPSEQSKL